MKHVHIDSLFLITSRCSFKQILGLLFALHAFVAWPTVSPVPLASRPQRTTVATQALRKRARRKIYNDESHVKHYNRDSPDGY